MLQLKWDTFYHKEKKEQMKEVIENMQKEKLSQEKEMAGKK